MRNALLHERCGAEVWLSEQLLMTSKEILESTRRIMGTIEQPPHRKIV